MDCENEKMFWFNLKLDKFVLHPVASGYAFVLPKPARESVGNFFNNVNFIPRAANNLFQLKMANAGGYFFIRGRDHAAFASGQYFPRVKAEAGQEAMRHADALALIGRTNRAGGIFDYKQIVAIRNFADFGESCRQADLMNNQNSARAGSNCLLNATRIEIESHRIDVDKDRSGADVADRIGCRNEGKARAEHFVARAYSGGHET